jgi:hypothetical protein
MRFYSLYFLVILDNSVIHSPQNYLGLITMQIISKFLGSSLYRLMKELYSTQNIHFPFSIYLHNIIIIFYIYYKLHFFKTLSSTLIHTILLLIIFNYLSLLIKITIFE